MKPLRRATPAPPVRAIHLGLGNFFRAHQAWYTAAAPDAARWGIAAFTGRSPALADILRAQDTLYTLVVRGPDRDETVVPESLSEVYAGTDHDAWRRLWQRPEIALATLTVTEAAYRRGADGGLDDTDATVQDDIAALRAGEPRDVRTVPGRLVAGLAARRAAGGGPVAIVSCDNLPDNADVAGRVVHELAGLADPALDRWIGDNVSFVTTVVDRITPATSPADLAAVTRLTGNADAVPVVTEPYHEWILSGHFPAGRPAWDAIGARFVTDVLPHEQRKLWLLNGGHSLLAYSGGAHGHTTVAQALADPVCRRALERWWDEAARHLTLPAAEIAAYRAALVERWSNPRIEHRLAQIAADGSQKIPIRILPVLRLSRAEEHLPAGAVHVLAAWIGHLRGRSTPIRDAGAAPFAAAAGSPRDVLALLDSQLAADRELVTALDNELTALDGERGAS
ncbi:mannitol dehydrogenase family protein [Phytohabitans aurantiacus]|uniref:Mannitol-1-phosphate 5-dehydrogenase n=1 Tax=Phytohabitans aurantiacus TaxID=3016789 RepID=A0ABQ5R078_9ACTN|nr:mannitol dehydrogenase family protein [Phytohabitans aurantiacus]GLI00209.1 mannitol dehydrogenase [Phytohabitans aurantiacus]